MNHRLLNLMSKVAIGATLAACGDTGQGVNAGATVPAFEDSALDSYEIEVLPELSALQSVTTRSDEPFVMVNMLVFKDAATGAGFEGLTGIEAYRMYADGLREAQLEIGSRTIWVATVHAQVVGSSHPVFQAMALIEYMSPSIFLGFATEPGDNPEARSAGLEGQWLIPSTTLAGGDAARDPTGGTPEVLPDVDSLAVSTGLSEAQIARVLDGPTDEPVFIIELLRFTGGDRSAYQQYEDGLAPVLEERGARLVWRGSYDGFTLGAAGPSFDEQVVTEYPNRAAYLLALGDPRVAAVSDFRADGLDMHWIYTAGDAEIDLGF